MSGIIVPSMRPALLRFPDWKRYLPTLGGAKSLTAQVRAALGWDPPVNVFRDGSNYYTDYDPTPFLVEGDPGVTTMYVDSDTGSDGNPGTAMLPRATLLSIGAARQEKLLIKARGKFYQNITSHLYMHHDNLCVQAWDGDPLVMTTETNAVAPFVWTDAGAGVWWSPQPYGAFNSLSAFEGTDADTMVFYQNVATLAECQSTPGTVFTDYGASPLRFYVHTLDGTSPATNHTLFNNNGSAVNVTLSGFNYPQRIAFYGASFQGGNTAALVKNVSAYDKRVDFVGCSFKRASNFAAQHSVGDVTVVMYDCVAGPSRFDGFSASTVSGGADGTPVPNVVEINCIGRNNGYVSGANQGSTTHFGGKTMRVNGQYFGNSNDQVADVGEGTRSWCGGCTMGPSGGAGYSGVQVGNNGADVQMYLDGCVLTGNTYAAGVVAGATLHYTNMAAPSPVAGGGALVPY